MIEKLNVLQEEAANCTKCCLSLTRNKSVFARGNPNAKILFLGEAPGQDENNEGKPFVGKSGKFLDKVLDKCGLSENNVYICNTVKCRPPDNRKPLQNEINACSYFLNGQLEIIKPKIIIVLGMIAYKALCEDKIKTISSIIGQKKIIGNKYSIYPTYHPSYLSRYGSIIQKNEFENIIKMAIKEVL